jgi:methionyl-tRNA formyltransferase
MRIVFMGTPKFAVPSLEILLKNGYEISAVVTAPDKPRGRGQQVSFTPIKEFAINHGLSILQPEKMRDEQFISALRSLNPDLIVVVAFRILPPEVFSLPSCGSFNLHASLLPKYRGAAPINWAIINGDKETGVTSFFLKEKVDTGSILLQEVLTIDENETAGELHDRLSELGSRVVLHSVQLIESGRVQARPQDESLASPAPKIFKDDCRIQWHKTAVELHNIIRGLSPHPCAWTVHHGKNIKLYKSILLEKSIVSPGTVVEVTNESLCIGTGKGVLSIIEIQQEGKKRLGIKEFLRGYPISEGDLFS